jgi:hypothetical protein
MWDPWLGLIPNPGSGDGGCIDAIAAQLSLINTVLVGGSPNDMPTSAVVIDAGHNLSSNSGGLTNVTSRPDTNALVGPLGYYGGRTPTLPLLCGSPAIDAGDDSAAPPRDQRGFPRPFGAAADIGAYEWGAAPPTPPRFTSCRYLSNATEVCVSGEIGRRFEIHASSNLTHWFWLTTLTNNTGQMIWTDANILDHPTRFYRAIQLP